MPFPEVKWAERDELLLVTIVCPDAKDPVVDLKAEGNLAFSGTCGDVKYEFDLPLNGKINVEETTKSVTDRQVELKIKKEEAGFWGKMWTTKQKPHFLTVDWSKWADEDEVDEAEDLSGFGGMEGMGGMPGGMGGMGGMPGMGGMGGMPGMGGMGGMPGMGGMGGGMGGMDFAEMMKNMPQGGMDGMGDDGEEGEDDEDEMPPLETGEAK